VRIATGKNDLFFSGDTCQVSSTLHTQHLTLHPQL